MIAYFDPCFWRKPYKNKLEAQNTSAEKLQYETVFAELAFLLKTFRWLLLETVWSFTFSSLRFLVFQNKNDISSLVVISTYDVQLSWPESDITFDYLRIYKI